MNKIVAIYKKESEAKKVIKALEDINIRKDDLKTFARERIELEGISDAAPGEVMVTAHVSDDEKDQALTIFKNSDATQVNTFENEWEPETSWAPVALKFDPHG